jgi:hypothetical protein
MKTSTLHIDKPSDRLLDNLRNLRKAKEERKEQMRIDWNKYFPKK